jgi:hypothetical protein
LTLTDFFDKSDLQMMNPGGPHVSALIRTPFSSV